MFKCKQSILEPEIWYQTLQITIFYLYTTKTIRQSLDVLGSITIYKNENRDWFIKKTLMCRATLS